MPVEFVLSIGKPNGEFHPTTGKPSKIFSASIRPVDCAVLCLCPSFVTFPLFPSHVHTPVHVQQILLMFIPPCLPPCACTISFVVASSSTDHFKNLQLSRNFVVRFFRPQSFPGYDNVHVYLYDCWGKRTTDPVTGKTVLAHCTAATEAVIGVSCWFVSLFIRFVEASFKNSISNGRFLFLTFVRRPFFRQFFFFFWFNSSVPLTAG